MVMGHNATAQLLHLDDVAIVDDFMVLLDHKKYWDVLDSIYDDIDIITQYTYCLNQKSINKKLDRDILTRISRPFKFFLDCLIAQPITIQEFRTCIIKFIEHDNRDAFLDFLENVHTNRKTHIEKLYATRRFLNQHEHSILKDFSVTKCNADLQFSDTTINVPFILLHISDKTYQCTINDIKIMTNILNSAIEYGGNVE